MPAASARRPKATTRRLAGEDVARLVARAGDGEQQAWNELVDEFGGVVWAATRAHRLRGADAADVFQTTWLRLIESLDRIEDPTCLGPWLATTARRECLKVIARTSRLIPRGDDLPDLPSDAPQPEERLLSEQRAHAVRAALGRLAPRDRALLRMLAAEPAASYEEIAAALGMEVGSIGPTRARALARLRSQAAGQPGRRGIARVLPIATASDRAAAAGGA
jgi:RNA polymerase sigma factor (sigma-70 family)